MPVVASRVIPAGNAVTDHVQGEVPPEAVRLCDQALPTVAAFSAPDAGVTASTGGVTVRDTEASPEVPPLLDAFHIKLSLPE